MSQVKNFSDRSFLDLILNANTVDGFERKKKTFSVRRYHPERQQSKTEVLGEPNNYSWL